jgi:photosystem II stability/assembly factor-like uncharacterized protein
VGKSFFEEGGEPMKHLYRVSLVLWTLMSSQVPAQNFWQATTQPGSGGSVGAVVVNSSGWIFAGLYEGGVYRSTNNGDTWTQVNTGLSSLHVYSLATTASGYILAGTESGIFRSTDNGGTWSRVGLLGTYVTSLNTYGSAVFAGDGMWCTGIYKSLDDGASWSCFSCGGFFSICVNAVAVTTSGVVLAGTGDAGVFRTTNNGATWVPVNNGLTSINVVRMLLNKSDHLFVSTTTNIYTGGQGAGIFRSTDNGSTWVRVSSGLTTNKMRALGMNSLGHLFAGVEDHGGVFRSTDNGNSWVPINSGLPDTSTAVSAFAFNGAGYIIAVIGGNVFRGVQPTTPGTVTVRYPELFLSTASLLQGQSITIQGKGFTPQGGVAFYIVGPQGFATVKTLLGANAQGDLTYTFNTTTSTPAGQYSTYMEDVARGVTSPVKIFQVTSVPQDFALSVLSPRSGDVATAGANIHVAWVDKMQLGSQYPIQGARRLYQYGIDLSSTGGSSWQNIASISGSAIIDEVVTFGYDFPITELGTNFIIRVTDSYQQSRRATSGLFSVQPPTSDNLEADLVWDYSYPEFRTGNPVGVAADGVARIYLRVRKKNPLIGSPVSNVSVGLLDGLNTEARVLGRVMVATTIDSYSEEANSATGTSATDNSSNKAEYWFWYVAPDDFVGRDPQDTLKSFRQVRVQITVTYSTGSQDLLEKNLMIVRPPLVLAHGLGGSPETWDEFSYISQGNIRVYFKDDPRFQARRAVSLSRDASFAVNGLTLVLPQDPNSLPAVISQLRLSGFAANQAYYVGHSMGGNVLRAAMQLHSGRYYASDSRNERYRNYGKGYGNRLITLDTPHQGSPLADLVSGPLLDEINRSTIKRLLLSSLFIDFENYSWFFPRNLWYPVTLSGLSQIVSRFDATDALKDLRVDGGTRFGETPLRSHLVAGDVVPGEQTIPDVEIPAEVWEGLATSKTIVKYLDYLFDVYYVIATGDIKGALYDLLSATPEKRVLTFLQIACGLIEVVPVVLEGDAIVSVKSQLAGLQRSSTNLTVFPFVFHTAAFSRSVTQNLDVGNRVNLLLNACGTSNLFANIPSSSISSTQPVLVSRLRRAQPNRRVISHEASSVLRISRPSDRTDVAVDSTFTISVALSDTASLSYLKVYFQDQIFLTTAKAFAYDFSVQVSGNKPDSQKVEALAVFDYTDSSVVVIDQITVNVLPNSPLLDFAVEPKVLQVRKNETRSANYKAVYPTFISDVSGIGSTITASIENPSVASYDASAKSFKGLAQGETYATVSYGAGSQRLYLIVEGELIVLQPPELVSPNYGATGVSTSPIFTWGASSGATTYRVQVSTDSAFLSTIIDTSEVPGTSLQLSGLAGSTTYYWRVSSMTTGGTSAFSSIWKFMTGLPVSVEKVGDMLPKYYSLLQNYPNPFNPSTTIEFSLPRSSYVTLKVFNLLGEEVATLAGQDFKAGSYRVDWNAKGVASGVYLYRLVAGSFVETKKMLLLR